MQTVTGEVRRFDGPGGWYYVDVPEDVAEAVAEGPHGCDADPVTGARR